MNTRISIIAAMAKNRVIGINNAMPWHLPAELKHFKNLTMGHPILMGRKTFESIGRPLPGRTTIIITRNGQYAAEGSIVVNSIESAIQTCKNESEIFFIGGAELYTQALGVANRIYLTEIQVEFEGDAYFPEFDRAIWKETSREHSMVLPGDLEYHFVVYDRI